MTVTLTHMAPFPFGRQVLGGHPGLQWAVFRLSCLRIQDPSFERNVAQKRKQMDRTQPAAVPRAARGQELGPRLPPRDRRHPAPTGGKTDDPQPGPPTSNDTDPPGVLPAAPSISPEAAPAAHCPASSGGQKRGGPKPATKGPAGPRGPAVPAQAPPGRVCPGPTPTCVQAEGCVPRCAGGLSPAAWEDCGRPAVTGDTL